MSSQQDWLIVVIQVSYCVSLLLSSAADSQVSTLWLVHATTLCLKNVPPLQLAVIFTYSLIATIFGTNVAEKAGNQNVLYFPTSAN